MKNSEIREYRNAQLERQGYLCPLCHRRIQVDEAALDHCHKTGLVRLVLHRWCNAVLGRVENWAGRSGINGVAFLSNTVKYLSSVHSDVIHPTHGKKRRRKKVVRTTRRKKK